MPASSSFEIIPGSIDVILRGPESMAQKRHQAEKIKRAWQDGINDDTGATDDSIHVEQRGTEVLIVADSGSESAWLYREYGTYDQKATHPGRRAIRGG